ncbi:MAG: type IX secretion system membrane protein PorP/SprF [Bacteroidales bacterium]
MLGALSFLACKGVFAQQKVQNTMYLFNPLSYNPAYAGTNGEMAASAIFRNQWTNIDGAPITGFLTLESPIWKNLSLGVNAEYDQIGARTNAGGAVDLAAKVKLNQQGQFLSMGIKLGVNNVNFDNTKFNSVVNEGEPLNTSWSRTNFNFDLGLYWYGEQFYFGLSTLSLLENPMVTDGLNGLDGSIYKSRMHFYHFGAYYWELSQNVAFKPSYMLKYVDNAPMSFDLNASFLLYHLAWVGANFRYDNTVGAHLIMNISPNLELGYAYEFAIDKDSQNLGGTHEVMLRYRYKKSIKFRTPRRF